MDDLLLIEEKIDLEVRSLETCMFDHKTFSDILNRVQKAVDDLNLYSYSNLPIWVNKLDIEVGTMCVLNLFLGFIDLRARLTFNLFFRRSNVSSECGFRLASKRGPRCFVVR